MEAVERPEWHCGKGILGDLEVWMSRPPKKGCCEVFCAFTACNLEAEAGAGHIVQQLVALFVLWHLLDTRHAVLGPVACMLHATLWWDGCPCRAGAYQCPTSTWHEAHVQPQDSGQLCHVPGKRYSTSQPLQLQYVRVLTASLPHGGA